MDEKPIW